MLAAGERQAAGPERRSLGETGRAALAWWLGELADMVPARLKARAGFGRPAAFDCVLMSDGRAFARRADPARGLRADLAETAEPVESEAFAARLASLADGAGRERTVRLSVPASLCLMRHVELPARALPHAGAILRHEIEALLPQAPADILCDWYVEAEDTAARRLVLRQVALIRPRIAAAEGALAAAGFRLSRLTVGDAEGRPVPVDLLASRRFGLRARLAALPLSAKLMHGLAAGLLAAALLLAAGRQAETLAALEAARAAMPRPSPAALSASAVADFLDETARRPGAARLLDEVAGRLPPDAFLTAFSVSGSALALSVAGPGRGRAAASLEASPLVASVERQGEDGDALRLALTLAPAGEAPEAPR